MVYATILVMLLAPASGTFSLRVSVAEEFHGDYSFSLPDGREMVLIAVVEDGLGGIGVGSRVERVIELRVQSLIVNVACSSRNEFVILVRSGRNKGRILLGDIGLPWVILSGEHTRTPLE